MAEKKAARESSHHPGSLLNIGRRVGIDKQERYEEYDRQRCAKRAKKLSASAFPHSFSLTYVAAAPLKCASYAAVCRGR